MNSIPFGQLHHQIASTAHVWLHERAFLYGTYAQCHTCNDIIITMHPAPCTCTCTPAHAKPSGCMQWVDLNFTTDKVLVASPHAKVLSPPWLKIAWYNPASLHTN